MKQKYHKITENNLKVLHLESIRVMFYQVSCGLYLAFAMLLILVLGITLSAKTPILEALSIASFSEFFFSFIVLLFGLIVPTSTLIIARRFPPAPEVIFHKNTHLVTWKSGKFHLELPFNTINFATSRLLSKSGISTVMVAVFAIDNKPFFEGETASPNPDMRYRKDLCIYKAGTQADADESIEIIKSFMAGTYDDSPSKFDDL